MSLSKEEIVRAAQRFSKASDQTTEGHMVRLEVTPFAAMISEEVATEQAQAAIDHLQQERDVPPWVQGVLRDAADVAFLSGMLLMVELLDEVRDEVWGFLSQAVEHSAERRQTTFDDEDLEALQKWVSEMPEPAQKSRVEKIQDLALKTFVTSVQNEKLTPEGVDPNARWDRVVTDGPTGFGMSIDAMGNKKIVQYVNTDEVKS